MDTIKVLFGAIKSGVSELKEATNELDKNNLEVGIVKTRTTA